MHRYAGLSVSMQHAETDTFLSVLSHSGDVLSKLRSQREAGLFCDITLRTNGQSYSAHRAVLAAVSEYFQEIFTETQLSAKADIDLTGEYIPVHTQILTDSETSVIDDCNYMAIVCPWFRICTVTMRFILENKGYVAHSILDSS